MTRGRAALELPELPSREELYRRIKPGPRVKMAARLYASGAVKSKKAACEAVGLNPTYLSLLSRESVSHPEIVSIIGDVDRAIHDKNIALSVVIAMAARKALGRVNGLVDSQNEHIALKAASDILDRNPETSKTQKLQVTSFSLEGQDAKEIAQALVRSAEVREKFNAIGEGDFVKIGEGDEKPASESNGGDKERSKEDGSKGSVEVAPVPEVKQESGASGKVSEAVGDA